MYYSRGGVRNLDTGILLDCYPVVLHEDRYREVPTLESIVDNSDRPDVIMDHLIPLQTRIRKVDYP